MENALQYAQIFGYIVTAVFFVVMIKADIRILRVQMEGITNNLKILNDSFEKVGTILTKVAVTDQRILAIEEDIREMKHGRGFVK